MDAILRALSIYFFMILALRVSGKRTLAQITTFDFILLLIIGEATQQALLGNDFSITNAMVVIITLLSVEILFSIITLKNETLDKWMNGSPIIIVENGKLLHQRMNRERVSESDILESARRLQGLESIKQIKYAVLERNGGITIIPMSNK